MLFFGPEGIQNHEWPEILSRSITRNFAELAAAPRAGLTMGATAWPAYSHSMQCTLAGVRLHSLSLQPSHHRRISAQQLKIAEDTIKQRLRGEKYRLYKRVSCNIGVFVSGNEVRIILPRLLPAHSGVSRASTRDGADEL